MSNRFKRILHLASVALVALVATAGPLRAQPPADDETGPTEKEKVHTAVERGVALLLAMQEGDDEKNEWPYEGVYRVSEPGRAGAVIPIGYRVGGTALCAMALISAPGYGADEARQAAVHRATAFIIDATRHPLMSFEDYPPRYDVRGWGYCYGLTFLLLLEERGLTPLPLAEGARGAIRFFIDGLMASEIPARGGWNYAGRGDQDRPGSPSPFMTAPCVQALLVAEDRGYDVDVDVIERALDALEKSRVATGAFVYSGESASREAGSARATTPGASARMAVAEATLYLGGRSSPDRVRGAIDAFLVHWEWLDRRRARPGTHAGPYGIAPYYFYFGHYYAAQAIELLPSAERPEYRRRLRELLFVNRLEDGSWNDRVFERSAAYSTAMAMMALTMDGGPDS